MGWCFCEKPQIRYLVRGAIRGFLKNRGAGKGGKVKALGRKRQMAQKAHRLQKVLWMGLQTVKTDKTVVFKTFSKNTKM